MTDEQEPSGGRPAPPEAHHTPAEPAAIPPAAEQSQTAAPTAEPARAETGPGETASAGEQSATAAPTAETAPTETASAEKSPVGEQSPAAAPRAETGPAESGPAETPADAESTARPAEAPPAGKRPPHRTKTWIAATAAGVMLLGGGLAGYFIGAANDHDRRGGPGWHQEWNGSRGGEFGGDFGDGPRGPWDRRGDR